MDDLNAILNQLGTISPVWAAVVGVILILLRTRVINLPFSIPVIHPAATTETNGPLRQRLQDQIDKKFAALTADGWDEDDVYGGLVLAVRAFELSEDDEDEEDDE